MAKARLTLISPASTDKTVNLANVAWMFSCLPSDDSLARTLAPSIVEQAADRPFAVLASTDHDSHHATTELLAQLTRLGRPALHVIEFEPGTRDFPTIVGRVAARRPGAVVIVAGPEDSARAVLALRSVDPEVAILGVGRMGWKPVLADGEFVPRLILPLSLSYDHRVIDGADAARFTTRLGELLSDLRRLIL